MTYDQTSANLTVIIKYFQPQPAVNEKLLPSGGAAAAADEDDDEDALCSTSIQAGP